MKYSLLRLFTPLSFLVLLSGCVANEPTCTKNEMQALHQELKMLHSELDGIASKNDQELRHDLDKLALQQLEQHQNISEKLTALRQEQNATKVLLQERTKSLQMKPVVIYKEKKEIAKFQDKLVLGREESVLVEPSGIILRARIDTGAETSSIDARDIKEFERDGEKWVRFSLIDRKTNKPYKLEKKVLRRVNIIQSSLDGKYDRRVVVKLKIRVGDFSDLSEFTLTDRDHMDFPVLIGRSFLQDIALVDVSAKDLAPLLLKEQQQQGRKK